MDKDIKKIEDRVLKMKDSETKEKILKDIETKQKHKIVNKDGVRN